jgi:hypothetical protein
MSYCKRIDIYVLSVHAIRCIIVRVYEHYAWIFDLRNDAFAAYFIKKGRMPEYMCV